MSQFFERFFALGVLSSGHGRQVNWGYRVRASETQLRTMLEGVKQFHIPPFQRRYTWGPKEHEQLWRDVMSQYDALAQAKAEG